MFVVRIMVMKMVIARVRVMVMARVINLGMEWCA